VYRKYYSYNWLVSGNPIDGRDPSTESNKRDQLPIVGGPGAMRRVVQRSPLSIKLPSSRK